jgi:phosphoserine phosphatase RsbU/P
MGREEALDDFVGALFDDDAEKLYDNAPCGYLSTTPDGTIIKVNQTFLTLTGFTRAELVGRRRFVDLLSGGGRIYHETHYAPMLRLQDKAREIALDLVRADGRRLPVLVNAVLERDEEGAPRLIRAAVFDATDRRTYEQELLRAKERAEAGEAQAAALARILQQTLIPPVPPTVPGLDIAARYRPAGEGAEVGGDFYDVFQLGPDDWVAVLGDVCGKGPEAAVVTALLRYAIRAAVVADPDPQAAFKVTNDVLLRHDTERFCTALLVRLHRQPEHWVATICAAGHPLPVLVEPDGSSRLVGEPGALLGTDLFPEVTATTLPLTSGRRLLLYTDGVTEARCGSREYGDDRLLTVASAAAPGAAALVDEVLGDVVAFQPGSPRDDIALLAITST